MFEQEEAVKMSRWQDVKMTRWQKRSCVQCLAVSRVVTEPGGRTGAGCSDSRGGYHRIVLDPQTALHCTALLSNRTNSRQSITDDTSSINDYVM